MKRKAVVAGQFYPANQKSLLRQIEELIDKQAQKQDVLAVIMPHAGYIYSGPVAGKTISQVKINNTALILGPNHTGLGGPYNLISSGTWSTPLGEVPINENLAKLLIKNSSVIVEDESAHIYEHSIEVELPFLQYFNKNITIVPMIISDFLPGNFKKVGEEIAQAIQQYEKPTLIVASTDMTHYEPHEQARDKDKAAIEAILELDPEKLYAAVNKQKISMCGIAPVEVALYACKNLGAKNAQLIEYQTSGDTSGDYSSVVGYAGIVIKQ